MLQPRSPGSRSVLPLKTDWEDQCERMTLLSRSNGKGGKLGVAFGEHPDTKETILSEIFKGFAADGQNLCVGDVVVSINGQPTRTAVAAAYAACNKAGDLVEIETTNYRALRVLRLRRRVATTGSAQKLGVAFGLDEQGRLAVTKLFPGYEADEKLLVGDRVLSINGEDVEDPQLATRLCTSGGDVVELRVISNRVNNASERSDPGSMGSSQSASPRYTGSSSHPSSPPR